MSNKVKTLGVMPSSKQSFVKISAMPGKPPVLESNLQPMLTQAQDDPVDKPRQFLGPREG